jgi:hypothetical protein
MSLGFGPDDWGKVVSGNSDCSGVVDEPARLCENALRRDAKLRLEGVPVGGGDGSWLERDEGDEGTVARIVDAGVTGLFFEVKERMKDHSDSNWMPSNSVGSAE